MIEPIQLQLLSFANQLGKLLKVIHHSDPSAESMKKPLYQKYKASLEDFYQMNQDMVPWAELKRLISELSSLNEFVLDPAIKQVVLKKLSQDLQDKYTTPHHLPEFKQPTRPPQTKKQPRQTSAAKPAPINPELVIQMAQLDERQQKAAHSLQGLIDAINRMDPQFLEQKILSALPRKLDKENS